MTPAATPPSRALIGSDRVEGTAVYDHDGHHTGTVQRLMIDKISGRVAYVEVTFAYPDLVNDSYTIPWGKLKYEPKLGGYLTDITETELRGVPRFVQGDDDNAFGQDKEEELHAYFRIPPYWRAI